MRAWVWPGNSADRLLEQRRRFLGALQALGQNGGELVAGMGIAGEQRDRILEQCRRFFGTQQALGELVAPLLILRKPPDRFPTHKLGVLKTIGSSQRVAIERPCKDVGRIVRESELSEARRRFSPRLCFADRRVLDEPHAHIAGGADEIEDVAGRVGVALVPGNELVDSLALAWQKAKKFLAEFSHGLLEREDWPNM